MKLHSLTKIKGHKRSKRVGRGNASGMGTYSGRGCKGMGQRKSGNVRRGFEGGQTPLLRRIPKLKGFRSPNKIYYQVVNLKNLSQIKDETINVDVLFENKLISKKTIPVKILGFGECEKKMSVDKDIKLSKAAKQKIEKAGGKILR